jgi:hypothetical protein
MNRNQETGVVCLVDGPCSLREQLGMEWSDPERWRVTGLGNEWLYARAIDQNNDLKGTH